MAADPRGVEQQLDEVRARLKLRGPRVFYRSLYGRLPAILEEGEEIVAFGDGYLFERSRRARPTYVVLTDRRLLGLREEIEEVPLDAIRKLERLEGGGSGVLGFTGGAFRVATADRELVVRVRPNSVAQAMADHIVPHPGAEETSPVADPLEAIRRLGELRDSGLISSEEFEAKKAELLARL